MISFDDFKRLINLGSFIGSYGYVLNKKSSTKTSSVLQKIDADGNSSETLIVRINNQNGQYVYSNPNNRFDKGSIIDFVNNKISLGDFNKTSLILNNYLGEAIQEPTPVFKIKEKIKKEGFEKQDFNLTPLKNFTYLVSRGITEKTIFSPEFTNRIFNYIKKSENSKKEFINIAFPMYNDTGLSGAEIKNDKLKGTLEGSNQIDSVWISNFNKDKPIDKLVLGEAIIDLLSYYQLHHIEGENVIYVGSNGYWTRQQMELCQKNIVLKYKPGSIVLANDYDLNGILYNINLAGFLGSDKDRIETFLIPDKVILRFYFNKPDDLNGLFDDIENIKELYASKFEVNYLEISFEKNIDVIKKLDALVVKRRSSDLKFLIVRPNNKDFNEDVMLIKSSEL